MILYYANSDKEQLIKISEYSCAIAAIILSGGDDPGISYKHEDEDQQTGNLEIFVDLYLFVL